MSKFEEIHGLTDTFFQAEQTADREGLVKTANELTKFCLTKLPDDSQALFSIANDYFKKGSLAVPETICRAIRARLGNHFESTHLLGVIALHSRHYEDAADLLTECVRLKPNLAILHHDLAESLLRAGHYEFALSECNLILENEPGHFRTLGIQAEAMVKLAKFDPALEIYDRLLHEQAENPVILMRKGQVHRILGQSQEARNAYEQAMKHDPDNAEAFWNLVNLDSASIDEKQYSEMLALYEKTSNDNKVYLAHALGKLSEDREQYDDAFNYYQQGKELSKAKNHFDPEKHSQLVESYINTFDQEFAAKYSNMGNDSSDPVFILGLPRSGSTLLEQILGSHSQVDATVELTEISSMVKSLSRVQIDNIEIGYPAILKHLSAAELTALGSEYLKRTRIYRGSGQFFTDKTPHNFLYIGLIKCILPNAKIIDARRQPMDAGLSIFKQHFPEGFAFANDLFDIGRYYKDYIRLMQHWDVIFPDAVLRVNYEDVVSDTENEVRRILDYLNLQFEDACLDFYENKRAVATISSEQVRQPIYSRAIDYWKHFESHLQPLKDGLVS